ncbi:LysR family transcriptional regulator [Acidiferrimicrobium sp. IK]|uniref:LysR family transcriptional regulator n=1 Tax=Acidiferrimicrobium sp. IK TaxID=2871700 RepID=UPI0021CB6E16|nr:LysR family transcriptional regulator [Acidiferrimicrobium sp. IK]MCU4185279.1 LysR family transcriptional regulator [Acidiferrimicrobium sp. IK]
MPLAEPIPDLAALDLLVTVGELGSINAAAEAHGITQPAASMRLRALERALGLQLLERARTGSRLTPAGQAAVEWAAVILDGMRALQAGTAALRRDARSHLRLGASLTVAEYLVPGWLRQLRSALPEVGVSLEMGNSSHVIDLVSGGDIELGFIEGPAVPRRLRSCDLGSDALVVVVGAGHPWARRRRPLGAAELAATPLVLREQGSGTRDILAAELAAHGLEVTALMELASTTAIKGATVAGAAPAVLSALAVEAEVRSGELVVVPCPELRFERTIRAVWAGGRRPGPAAARLLDIAESAAWPRADRGPSAGP